MNKARKKLIEDALDLLNEARADEESALANLPDSFRAGQKGEEMEENIEALEDAISALDKFA